MPGSWKSICSRSVFVQIDWKTKLGSRRTLGRLIRFQLLLTLIFVAATVVLLMIPAEKASKTRSSAASALVFARGETGFRYPFPVYSKLSSARSSLYEYAEIRRVFAELLTVEEEPVVVEENKADEESEQKQPPPPPPAAPDLDGLVLVGTLTDAEGKSIAIIRDDNIGETVYVREGDDLNGSIVELISDNSVVVVLDDETDELLGASYEF